MTGSTRMSSIGRRVGHSDATRRDPAGTAPVAVGLAPRGGVGGTLLREWEPSRNHWAPGNAGVVPDGRTLPARRRHHKENRTTPAGTAPKTDVPALCEGITLGVQASGRATAHDRSRKNRPVSVIMRACTG